MGDRRVLCRTGIENRILRVQQLALSLWAWKKDEHHFGFVSRGTNNEGTESFAVLFILMPLLARHNCSEVSIGLHLGGVRAVKENIILQQLKAVIQEL